MKHLLSYVAQLSMLILVAVSTLPLAYAQGCATTPPLQPDRGQSCNIAIRYSKLLIRVTASSDLSKSFEFVSSDK